MILGQALALAGPVLAKRSRPYALAGQAKARYPWAKAWVRVRGGFWCFESEAEARGYEAGFHEPFVGREPGRPKRQP